MIATFGPFLPCPSYPVHIEGGTTTAKAQQRSPRGLTASGRKAPRSCMPGVAWLSATPAVVLSRERALGHALGFGEGTHDSSTTCAVGRWRC